MESVWNVLIDWQSCSNWISLEKKTLLWNKVQFVPNFNAQFFFKRLSTLILHFSTWFDDFYRIYLGFTEICSCFEFFDIMFSQNPSPVFQQKNNVSSVPIWSYKLQWFFSIEYSDKNLPLNPLFPNFSQTYLLSYFIPLPRERIAIY